MIFADLKMVKQTDKKYHWEMESSSENTQGAYNNNECWFSYEIWGNVAIMFSQIIMKWWQIEMRKDPSENKGIYQWMNIWEHL